jgi:hypothetical protein
MPNLVNPALYPQEAVWVGAPGTQGEVEPGVNGTVLNPVNNMADAKTIADALGLQKFFLRRIYPVNLEANMFGGYLFDGWLSRLNLNGKRIDNCVFRNLEITGDGLVPDYTPAAATRFEDCKIDFPSIGPSHYIRCQGHPNLGGYGHYEFVDCYQFTSLSPYGTWITVKGGEGSCPTFLKYRGARFDSLVVFKGMRHDTAIDFQSLTTKRVQIEGEVGGHVQINGPEVLDLRSPL